MNLTPGTHNILAVCAEDKIVGRTWTGCRLCLSWRVHVDAVESKYLTVVGALSRYGRCAGAAPGCACPCPLALGFPIRARPGPAKGGPYRRGPPVGRHAESNPKILR